MKQLTIISFCVNSINSDRNQKLDVELKFSFHHLDMMAFFGFEYEVGRDFVLDESDLKFQTRIRNMVRDFVWNNASQAHHSQKSYDLLVNGTKQTVDDDDYRNDKCRLWREMLNNQSYAWIS